MRLGSGVKPSGLRVYTPHLEGRPPKDRTVLRRSSSGLHVGRVRKAEFGPPRSSQVGFSSFIFSLISLYVPVLAFWDSAAAGRVVLGTSMFQLGNFCSGFVVSTLQVNGSGWELRSWSPSASSYATGRAPTMPVSFVGTSTSTLGACQRSQP